MAQRKRNSGAIRDLESDVDSLETAVDTIEASLGGVQQAKARASISLASGVPTLDEGENITLITDTGAGRVTLTIGDDFVTATGGASSTWTCVLGLDSGSSASSFPNYSAKAAGSVELRSVSLIDTFIDPDRYDFAGLGYQ
jgi:hypothetical protein